VTVSPDNCSYGGGRFTFTVAGENLDQTIAGFISQVFPL
jgi:hypothetical protein